MRKKQQKASVRFAVSAMERATEGVPSEMRNRYRDELVAEMHDLGRVAAWRHALGVALSSSSMHAALTDGGPAPEPQVRPPAACRMNLHHVWVTRHTSDGKLYRACSRCGKDYVSTGTAPMISP